MARPAGIEQFAPGFRLSARDVVVLVLGTAAAFALATLEPWWGVIVAFVVAHFFLFCNVLRMARPFELAWAAVFLSLAVSTLMLDMPGWPTTISISLLVTLVVAVWQMRRPSYHGAGWQRINPGLRLWWDTRRS